VKGEPKRFVLGHVFRGRTHSAESRLKISIANSGRVASPETRMKLSQALKGHKPANVPMGELSPHWKGDQVSYTGLHLWVGKHKVKTGTCTGCGRKKITEWANISGVYLRDLDDFAEMCKECHRELDGYGEE
jgi:NUMOD3 motif